MFMGGTGGFFEVTAPLPLFSSVTISSVILNILSQRARMEGPTRITLFVMHTFSSLDFPRLNNPPFPPIDPIDFIK